MTMSKKSMVTLIGVAVKKNVFITWQQIPTQLC